MHDIKTIREAPAAFDAALARRGLPPQAQALLALDEALRTLQTQVQAKLAARNEASRLIGQAKAKGEDASVLMAQVAALKEDIPALEAAVREAEAALFAPLSALPNRLAEDVPDGADESANVELRRWGTPGAFDFPVRDHVDLGAALGMDFAAAAAMSGARFVVLRGPLARLERALGQYMLDVQTLENGYTEISPPLLLHAHAMFGVGQLPKFEADLFKTTDATPHYLLPTAEAPLTNLVRDQILEEETLPLRYTALTPCFRSEAGSAGRDTRGMIRMHQFHKVEMVSFTTPEQAPDEFHRMVGFAETLLQLLGLPYRVMALCGGDTSFSAARTYDLEVWLPGQNSYREVSSCSWFGDFQARRMNSRCRARGGKATRFLHTLNGSGLPLARPLVAIIENYQNADGSIRIPDVLIPYMGGVTRLDPAP